MSAEDTNYLDLETGLLAPISSPSPNMSVDSSQVETTSSMSSDEYEKYALGILSSSKSYETDVENLIQTYNTNKFDDEEDAKRILTEYSEYLRYKNKSNLPSKEDLLSILPNKLDVPEDATDSQKIDALNKYEEINNSFLDSTDDSDYLAQKEPLKKALSLYSSEARRSISGNYGEGIIAFAEDKGARFIEGLASPFLNLVGADETDKWLREHTAPERDSTLASDLASGAGSMVPIIASAVTGPAAPWVAGGVMAAQSAGEAKRMYNLSMEATGDERKALQSATLSGAAGVVAMLPFGKLVGKFAEKIATKSLLNKAVEEGVEKAVEKEAISDTGITLLDRLTESLDLEKQKGFVNIPKTMFEAGLFGSASRVLSNAATNVGLDQDGNITEGVAQSFITNSMLGGAISGAETMLTNASLNQAKRNIEGIKELYKEQRLTDIEASKKDSVATLSYKEGIDTTHYIESDDELPGISNRVGFDDKGNVVTAKPREVSEEEQRASWIQFEKKEAKKQQESLYDLDTIRDEDGEPVQLKSGPDEWVSLNDISEGAVLTSDETPATTTNTNPYLVMMAGKELGSKISLARNIAETSLGQFRYKKGLPPGTIGPDGVPIKDEIRLLRSLGADPAQLQLTLAHEIGHNVDRWSDPSMKSLKSLVEASGNPATLKEAAALSATWRGGWDGVIDLASDNKYIKYRSNSKEIFADVFSAIANDIDTAKRIAPNLVETIEKNLIKNPHLNDIYTNLIKFQKDPGAAREFVLARKLEGMKEQARIAGVAEGKRIKDNSFGSKMRRELETLEMQIFEKYATARRVVSKMDKETQEVAFPLLNDLMRKDYAADYLTRTYDNPLVKVTEKLTNNDIPLHYFSQRLWADKVELEKTPTMARIEDNPNKYREAAREIRTFLSDKERSKGVISPEDITKYFSEEAISTTEGLTDAFAAIQFISDTAKIIDVADFYRGIDPANPKRDSIATKRANLARARLAKRKKSIPFEALQKWANSKMDETVTPQAIQEAIQDVTSDKAFAVRKYLINPDGYTRYDVAPDKAYIKSKLTDKQNEVMEELIKDFHAIYKPTYDLAKEAGLLTPDLQERIALNQDSYVFTNVLRHFEETGGNISGTIKSAVGGIGMTGDEMSSTNLKNKAIAVLAYRQRAENASVDIALLSKQAELVSNQKYGVNLFAEKTKLNAKDRDNTYMIKQVDGVPSLYKLQGKGWEQAFKASDNIPVARTLFPLVEAYNKFALTRQLKTIFNPAFIYRQKVYDRHLEAMYAGSKEFFLPFIPIHLSKKLRDIDARSRAELITHTKSLLDTGKSNLTGDFKTQVDLDGVTLDIMNNYAHGVENHMTAEAAIYDAIGETLPKENGWPSKIGDTIENGINKMGGQWLKNMAEFDELRTKLNGFKIAKEYLGMSDAEAAIFARERFGIPDPQGGGVYSPGINKMFLFGRAHFNGLRNMYRFIKETPSNAAFQITYRILLPKLMMSSAIMGPALLAAYGKNASDVYLKWLDMVGSFNKISKNAIPLGFQDGKGNFINMFDANAKDIQDDAKAWGFFLPQSRELTSLAAVAWPFLSGVEEGDIGKGLAGGAQGAYSQAMGNLQPAIQYVINGLQLIAGGNPTDFYRQKGILPKDIAESGSPVEKALGYGKYLGSSFAPSLFPYNPFSSDIPKNEVEKTLKSVPLVGPFARAFIGVSNYGTVENRKELKQGKDEIRADIRNSVDNTTKEVLDRYASAAATVSSLGQGWQKKVGPEVARQIRYLQAWHSNIWVHTQQALMKAKDQGNQKLYEMYLQDLEKKSQIAKEKANALSSDFSKKK